MVDRKDRRATGGAHEGRWTRSGGAWARAELPGEHPGERVQEQHEGEGRVVGRVGHEGADSFVHHQAAQGTAGGDHAEGKRERAARD